jgi:predicted nucleic acid-binding protein
MCVDASVVLKLVLNETDSHLAEALWRSWLISGIQPAGPCLLPFEVTAVLRKHVHRGTITTEYGLAALRQVMAFDVTLLSFPDLHERAWALASDLNRPFTYDAHYLAPAENLGCEYWTADKRLYQAVRGRLSWVRWLGDFADSRSGKPSSLGQSRSERSCGASRAG